MPAGCNFPPMIPQPVGETAIRWGCSVTAPHANHGHAVLIDNTLEFNASDELGVNVQDVIEHLQETQFSISRIPDNYSSRCRRNRWASLCD